MNWRLPILLLVVCPLSLPACELAGAERRDLDDGVVVYYRLEPEVLSLSEHFSMRLRVCRGQDAAQIEKFKIDARMPAHNHGMNYRPAVSELGDGLLQVSGMLFHMPGLWRIVVDFVSAERRHRFSIEYRM